MGVLYDYFVASSDADAAATIDRPGGPAQTEPLPAASGRGVFRRRRRTPDIDIKAYLTVPDTGIDPVVQGGTLEELLTGRPYEEIEQDPRWGHSLAVRNGGERLVLTLTESLIDALGQSNAETLAAVAVPWSQTEEFWGAGDSQELSRLLVQLSALAREARSRGESLYCWVSL
jgi:hypothetical protein